MTPTLHFCALWFMRKICSAIPTFWPMPRTPLKESSQVRPVLITAFSFSWHRLLVCVAGFWKEWCLCLGLYSIVGRLSSGSLWESCEQDRDGREAGWGLGAPGGSCIQRWITSWRSTRHCDWTLFWKLTLCWPLLRQAQGLVRCLEGRTRPRATVLGPFSPPRPGQVIWAVRASPSSSLRWADSLLIVSHSEENTTPCVPGKGPCISEKNSHRSFWILYEVTGPCFSRIIFSREKDHSPFSNLYTQIVFSLDVA